MANEILEQKKYIRNFSAGNKQKIGIISALINQPQLLVLDEPFNFLDPTWQNVLKHTLADYNAQTGATILISSHNLQHTVDISTRIALLEHGVIIRDLPNSEGSARTELETYFGAE
jgi:ABC-2 type transport system ATP-binding protein